MKVYWLFLLFFIPFYATAGDIIQGTYRVNQDTECNDGTRIAQTYDVIIDSQGTYSTSGYYTYRNDTDINPRTIAYVAGQVSCTGAFTQNQRTLQFGAASCISSDIADFSQNNTVPLATSSIYSLEIAASLDNSFFQFPAGSRNLILYNDPAEVETLNFPGFSFSRVCVRQGDGVRLKNNNTVTLPTIEPGVPVVQ